MNPKLLLATIVLTLAISATAGCGMAQTVATATPTPTSTPPANTPTATATPRPEPGWVEPPYGLWRDAVPPEAIETLRTLESASIPQRDLIELTLRLNDPGQPIPQVTRDEPWGFEIGDTHEFWVGNWDTHEYFQVIAVPSPSTPNCACG